MDLIYQLLFLVNLCIMRNAFAFQCPEDGHFPDPDDCNRFYGCANGVPRASNCPSGLMYNPLIHQCDWPEHVDCKVDLEKLKAQTLKNPSIIYLTFDDGPNSGTENVLNALKKFGVNATFFINSLNLNDPKQNYDQLRGLVKRIIDEGHILADHSYDHMKHNSNGPRNAYISIENDIKYFGKANLDPLLQIANEIDHDFVNYTMMTHVRMPYTNNWRIPIYYDGEKQISDNCGSCTVPAGTSGRNGIQMADEMAVKGSIIFGWDLEWNMNFNTLKYKYGGLSMFTRLKGAYTKRPKKIIVLTHDIGFKESAQELEVFLELATSAGYIFRTVDTYIYDQI